MGTFSPRHKVCFLSSNFLQLFLCFVLRKIYNAERVLAASNPGATKSRPGLTLYFLVGLQHNRVFLRPMPPRPFADGAVASGPMDGRGLFEEKFEG
jgi:hypothetical protein